MRVALHRAAFCACAMFLLVAAPPATATSQRTVTVTLHGAGKAFWKLNSTRETSRLALHYRWHGTFSFAVATALLKDPKHRGLSVTSTGRLVASWSGNYTNRKAEALATCTYRGTNVKRGVVAKLARGRAGNTLELILHPRTAPGFFSDKGRRAVVKCSAGTTQTAPPHFAPSWFFRDNLQDHGRFTSDTAIILLPRTLLPRGLATVAFPGERGRNDSPALGHLAWNNRGETAVRVR